MIKTDSYRKIVIRELQKLGNDLRYPKTPEKVWISYGMFENSIVRNSPNTVRKIRTEVIKDLSESELECLSAGLSEQFGCKVDVKFKKSCDFFKDLLIYFRK